MAWAREFLTAADMCMSMSILYIGWLGQHNPCQWMTWVWVSVIRDDTGMSILDIGRHWQYNPWQWMTCVSILMSIRNSGRHGHVYPWWRMWWACPVPYPYRALRRNFALCRHRGSASVTLIIVTRRTACWTIRNIHWNEKRGRPRQISVLLCAYLVVFFLFICRFVFYSLYL